MIIAPVADLDVVIRDTLREVRRGIAAARSANQANPTAGLMADLPEFIDFEIQVITAHQALSRDVTDVDLGNANNGEANTLSDTRTEYDNATTSESGSSTRTSSDSKSISQSRSGSQSGSRSESQSRSSSTSTSGSKSQSKSDSKSQSKSNSRSNSQSSSSKNLSQDQSDNGRTYGIIDEDTGEFKGGGESDLSHEPTPRSASTSC